jgi:hypothetical protein
MYTLFLFCVFCVYPLSAVQLRILGVLTPLIPLLTYLPLAPSSLSRRTIFRLDVVKSILEKESESRISKLYLLSQTSYFIES